MLVGALWTGAWVAGALITQGDRADALVLAAAQGVLALLTISIFRATLPPASSRSGVYVIPVLALHVALYYGVFNVVPALLIQWRPEYTFGVGINRIPEAPVSAYLSATCAAASLLFGVLLGSRLVESPANYRRSTRLSADRPFGWLPGYRTSLAVALGLGAIVLLATMRYGTEYGDMLVDEDRLAALPFSDQLIFHGIFPFLPLPAVLAAAAILAARTRRARHVAVVVFIGLALFSLGALSIWGMRSSAMLVFLIPMALFVYTGRMRWQSMLLPAVILGILVYGIVTVARISNLGEQLGQGMSLSPATVGEVLGSGADQHVLVERFISDISYRTSGLEAVAGIVEGQSRGVLSPMGGRVILAGFLQALPAAIRPAPDFPNRIKTAPSYAGWFVPGDYVTTLLSELVMDVGPWLVILPAIIAGLILTLFDRTLLILGQHEMLQPLLVVRMGWLLMVLNIDSLSSATLMFAKGTVGYWMLFIACGVCGLVVRKLARAQ